MEDTELAIVQDAEQHFYSIEQLAKITLSRLQERVTSLDPAFYREQAIFLQEIIDHARQAEAALRDWHNREVQQT